MDDGDGSVVAFVGGINPVQAYWDTPAHDSLDVRRVRQGTDPFEGLEKTPPLHDIFYRIKGPAVGDVLANFVERYNGASIPHKDVTSNVVPTVTADPIPQVANGIEVQVVRTIAPKTYPRTWAGRALSLLLQVVRIILQVVRIIAPKAYRARWDGDRGIRELYFNMLGAAGQGDLVYIENQYFFDHGIISEIHEAAERGAKIIAILTSKPDEGMLQGKVEDVLETIAHYQEELPIVADHDNVAMLTLGNSRPDPRTPGKLIYSETYIHSKTMAVLGKDWAYMTGGSANIAFTSMWFHSEMNIAFADVVLIKSWVARLWSEHLKVTVEKAMDLIGKPGDALRFFKDQATCNWLALEDDRMPEGRVYRWGCEFPARELDGIDLRALPNSGKR